MKKAFQRQRRLRFTFVLIFQVTCMRVSHIFLYIVLCSALIVTNYIQLSHVVLKGPSFAKHYKLNEVSQEFVDSSMTHQVC